MSAFVAISESGREIRGGLDWKDVEELPAVGAEAGEFGDWDGGDGNDSLFPLDDEGLVQAN